MKQEIIEDHKTDAEGNPTGGQTIGTGIRINWQDGPLGRGADRKDPNGAFVEGVIAAAIGRLHFYQSSKFACEENRDALYHLDQALAALNARTERRDVAGVEGTHSV